MKTNVKKVTIFVLVIMMILTIMPLQSFAASTPKIEINRQPITTDVDPFIKNDRTMVPIRFIAENLGYDVDWQRLPEIGSVLVKIRNEQKEVILITNSNKQVSTIIL